MAMKSRSPWWLSALLAVGLVAVFAGERAFGHLESLRSVLSGLGVLLVVGSTAARAWVLTRAAGRQRKVELISLVCHLGVLAALGVYYFCTDTGVAKIAGDDAEAIAKTRTMLTILWAIVLAVSTVPLLLIELSLGVTNRSSFRFEDEADASVDLFRVRELASSGLTIALAAAFLMVTCNVADQRNVRKDVSYFKTSSPGTATINMVKSMNEPLTVLLFFPEVSEVATEVEGYFEGLGAASGKVIVKRVDRLVDGELAKAHRVSRDGTIVLVRGDAEPPEPEAEAKDDPEADPHKGAVPPKAEVASEKITVSTDVKQARRSELREFDAKVQKAVMKVIRDKKVAYFSVGHGELNDPESAGPLEMANPMAKSTVLKSALRQLNYQVKDWDGFGKRVPDDASVLFVLAPRKPLLDEELRAIDDYLARGGALLFALDPKGEATLGELSGRLGVSFDGTQLADEREFMVRTRTPADHRLVLTNQFSAHASITTLGRGQARSGILFIEAGSLDEAPFTKKAGDKDPKRTFVIRSMASAFRDLDDSFTYDKDAEKKSRYILAAAIEDPSAVPEKLDEGETSDGMRAFVIADGDVFSDGLLSQVPIVQALVVDAIKWLGGEEEFAGETQSEKDVLIEHTKSEDAVWFYSTVVGAPILVLLFGLFRVLIVFVPGVGAPSSRRRKSGRKS